MKLSKTSQAVGLSFVFLLELIVMYLIQNYCREFSFIAIILLAVSVIGYSLAFAFCLRYGDRKNKKDD